MAESNLTQKLISVQKELKTPKNQWNKFGNYNYRSAEDILEAVKPLNANQGLLLTITDEVHLIGEWHYIKAIVTITDGKESITVSASARESEQKKGMDSSQVTGATSSYARKYALNGLYCIDDTKDVDTPEYQQPNNNKQQGNSSEEKNEQSQGKRTSAQIKRMYAIGHSAGFGKEDIIKVLNAKYEGKKPEELSKQEYDEVCSSMESAKGA